MHLSKSFTRAFKHKNYRLFWGGQVVSLLGTWMQRIAMAWLVYRLTNSPLMLGMVEFVTQMPAFLVAPMAGVYLDRWDRRRTLIITQILFMLQALTLAYLVLSGNVRIWHVILLSIFFGVIAAFDQAGRQTFLKDIVVIREDIGNAIALNSTMFNAGRLIGPAVAGITIALVGEGWCFFINGITFITILFALHRIKILPEPEMEHPGVLESFKEGIRYTWSTFPIRTILLVLGLVGFAGLPYTVLLPVFARDVFNGDARILGFLTSCTGFGALYGAFYLAHRRAVLGMERVMLLALLSAGSAFLLIALVQQLYAAMFLIIFVGFGFMAVFAAGNTILQTLVADDKRGRVMAIYTMTYNGMTPVGALISGAVTKHTSAPFTLFISGLLLLAGAALFYRYMGRVRGHIRHHQEPVAG